MDYNRIKIKTQIAQKTKDFISYFIESGLCIEINSDKEFEKAAQEYLLKNPNHNGCEKIFNLNLYKFPKQATLTEKSNFLRSIIKLLSKIKNIIVERDKPCYPRNIQFNRQVNPDISVYKGKKRYPLINYADNSYALIFDS